VNAPLMVLGIVLTVVGVVGTIVPILPGAPIVFVGLLVAAWSENFQKVGTFTLSLLFLLMLGSVLADFLATSLGVKKMGASWRAVIGTSVGTLVGFFFGLPGLLLGPFVGAVLGEWWARRDLRRAGKIGLAAWLGLLLGTAAKVAAAFMMVGLFVLAYLV
jgi:uncharacterized protein YqgC (DUF456 family)